MNWQPIETAPKNGTKVILWLPKTKRQQERWIVSFWRTGCIHQYWANEYGNGPAYNTYDKFEGRWVESAYSEVEPSHWMPEPTKPKE